MCGTCGSSWILGECLDISLNLSLCSHRWAATILSPEFITTLANAHHIPYLLWCGSKPSFVKFVRRFEYRAHCCSYRGCCGRRRDRETPGTSRNEYEKSDKKCVETTLYRFRTRTGASNASNASRKGCQGMEERGTSYTIFIKEYEERIGKRGIWSRFNEHTVTAVSHDLPGLCLVLLVCM